MSDFLLVEVSSYCSVGFSLHGTKAFTRTGWDSFLDLIEKKAWEGWAIDVYVGANDHVEYIDLADFVSDCSVHTISEQTYNELVAMNLHEIGWFPEFHCTTCDEVVGECVCDNLPT